MTNRKRKPKKQPNATPTPWPCPDRHPGRRDWCFEPVPQNWTNEQAVAVHHFCVAVQEMIWRQYPDALTDAAITAGLNRTATSADHRTLQLPFSDEELPF